MEDKRKETMNNINADVMSKKVNEIITFTDQLKTKVVEQDAKIVALESKVMAQAALLTAATAKKEPAPVTVPKAAPAAPVVEQPVAPDDLLGMKLCRRVGIPISADESLVTLKDALSLISQEACDVMNIKIPKV